MPEDQNIIFKLQLDASGYITGVNAASDATTRKFVDAQRKANDALIASKKALADVTTQIESLQQGIKSSEAEGQLGFADNLRKQLDAAVQKQAALTTEVENNTKAYNDATNAAEDFFKSQQKAQALVQSGAPAPVSNLQQLSLPFQEPGAQLSLFDQIPQGVANAVSETADQFKVLEDAIAAANLELEKLDKNSEDFRTGSIVIKEFGNNLLALKDALPLIGNNSEEARVKLVKIRDELEQSIKSTKIYSETLDKTSVARKNLDTVVNQEETILKVYNQSLEKSGDAAKSAEVKHLSFRQQLLNLRNEMGALSEAGQEDTEQFQKMEIEAAHLSELYRIQQNRIRILSSETKNLDFGKAAIQGAIGGFETLASVEVLFGQKQEEIEKITLKLFAAMQLLNGMEELEKLTKRDSTIVTLASSAATKAYTAVVGAATGATKALRIALLTTGVGAVVAGLGFLVAKFIALKEAQDEANRSAKIAQEINTKSIDGYIQQTTSLELLKRRLADANTPLQERIDLVKEYNKTADEGNQIDEKQVTNTDLVTAAINRQIEAIKERSTRAAADAITTEKATTLAKDQADAIDKASKFGDVFVQKKGQIAGSIKPLVTLEDISSLDKANAKLIEIQGRIFSKGFVDLSYEQKLALENTAAVLKDVVKDFGNYNAAVDLAAKLTAGLVPTTQQFAVGSLGKAIQDKTDELEKLKKDQLKAPKEQQEIFQAKIDQAQRELDALQGKKNTTVEKAADTFQTEFDALTTKKKELEAEISTSVASISEKFQAQLTQELDKINRLKIPTTKKQVLIDLAVKVNELEERKAIDEFTQRQVDATNKIDEELRSLNEKRNSVEINNIQEQFTKRAAIIDQNQNKEIGDAHELNDRLLRELDKDKQAGLLSEQQYQEDRQKTIENSEQLINQITIKYSRERQELALQTFTQNLQRFDDIVQQLTDTADEKIASVVREQSQRFLSGGINFSTFQKNIQDQTRIIQAQQRDDIIKQRQQELFEVQLKLDTQINLTTEAYATLKKKRDDLSRSLTALEKADALQDAEDVQARTKSRVDAIIGYADAIGSMAQSVIGFWQAANDAEERALDRSIQLQQRRVDEAQRIADRGNATYLKSETDRLRQLEVERENSARRQLGIDAALQASQILVGITGAIAKIGTGLGAAETIASIAVIVGALATGYGLIKQLQANQPRLKEGTPYLQRGTHPAGTDTIPAWLNEGEAVIPTETNRKYKPVIEAVYHEKVPAEVMNSFVKGYKEKISDKQYAKLDDRAKTTYLMYQVAKKFIGEKHDEKLISKETHRDVSRYMEVVNSSINKQLEAKKTSNIHEIIRDVVFDAQAKIIPFKMDRIRDTTYEKSLVNFVDTFYSLKEIPQPDYSHIAEVNQMQLGYDGKLRSVLEQQNELIKQNNEHHKETQNILKAMGISMSIDQNGVAAIAMDAIKQKQIDAKL